jgi:hypothetical protein
MYSAMFKNNPMMSLWMSAANSTAGSARGLWMAEMQRQQSAMMQEFTKQMIDLERRLGRPDGLDRASRCRAATAQSKRRG